MTNFVVEWFCILGEPLTSAIIVKLLPIIPIIIMRTEKIDAMIAASLGIKISSLFSN
jgi:hypothetical protein